MNDNLLHFIQSLQNCTRLHQDLTKTVGKLEQQIIDLQLKITKMYNEPIVHSHNTDCLDDDHEMLNKNVYCEKCNVIVHAFNNECMQTWIEYKGKALCSKCAKKYCLSPTINLMWAEET